jgi:uncharacterized protein (DUF433 family)
MLATAYRSIVKIPGVCGDRPIIEGTRIGVNDVVGLLQNGETVESLATVCFPELTRAQIYECLAYYEDHREVGRGNRGTCAKPPVARDHV